MKVYALYDERRDERGPLEAELKRQGIEAELIYCPSFLPGPPEITINFMHKLFVKLARKHNYPEVCILEADVLFPHPDGWKYFLRNKPHHYDLYLGGTYGNYFEAWHEMDSGVYYLTHRPAGFHCYCIHSRYYDKFLSVPGDVHIDDAQDSGDFFVCYPFAAIQKPSYSAHKRAYANYNHDFDKRPQDVYGYEYYHHSDYPPPK